MKRSRKLSSGRMMVEFRANFQCGVEGSPHCQPITPKRRPLLAGVWKSAGEVSPFKAARSAVNLY
jgi:hypothetical protein